MTSDNKFPVNQGVVEEGLLNAVAGNMSNWLDVAKFEAEDWSSRRDIFSFIGQYLQQYGNLPSQSQINTRFDWHPPIGDFAYWLAEMKRYSLARKVLEAIQDGYNQITDPDKALDSMLNKLGIIRSQQTNHIQATDSSALERLEKFDYRTENMFKQNRMIGLRTGMSIIDKTMMGWTAGSMVGCYARPGVGKTWWLLWEGVQAWYDGATVLCISPEMPANLLNLRIDTLVGAALGHSIDYGQLIVGNPIIRPNYALVTSILNQSQRWWTYDSVNDRAPSISDISGLVRQHHPDVLLVDGVGLLRPEHRGQTWEQMREVCYGLKNLGTISEVPILVTHQAVNSAKGKRTEVQVMGRGDDFIMPSLNDAADGESFVRACSDIITMCAEPTSRYVNWYSLRKSRERGFGELPARLGLAWDVGHGNIIDLSHLGYNIEEVGKETRRLLGV